jgi:hypothetical protein
MSASLPNKKTVLKSTIRQHWRTKIGCTSYRTIPVIVDGEILIGSNGDHFRDYALDEGNGVFLLNGQNGEITKNFENNQFGDMDVNGILHFNGSNYFGNDNEEFLCVDQNGKTKWRVDASGDIEHRPVLIQSSGKQLVVFATETGQIEALDALSGKEVWTYFDKAFSGWKMGENRTLFKIKMHFSEDFIFFNEPSLADLNADGVNDLVYNSKWGNFTAINGKNGKLLWEIDEDDHSDFYTNMGREKPIIIGEGEKSQIMILLNSTKDRKDEIAFYNAKGKLIHKVVSSFDLGSSMLSQTSDVFLTSTAIIIPSANPKDVKIIPIENTTYKNTNGTLINKYNQCQVASNKINFNDEPCALIVSQYDYENSSAGQSPMLLIGLKTGKIHYKVNLPSTSEFAPYIADVNKDGKLDVLVGCYDGNLYCFDLDISTSKLINN